MNLFIFFQTNKMSRFAVQLKTRKMVCVLISRIKEKKNEELEEEMRWGKRKNIEYLTP